MKTLVSTRKPKGIHEYRFESTSREFEQALDKAFDAKSADISIPGFHKGKVNRRLAESHLGKDYFYEDAIKMLMSEAFKAAAEADHLKVVASPQPSNVDVSPQGCVSFTVRVPVFPEVELGQYKGLRAHRPQVSITEQEVLEELEHIRSACDKLVPVDRPAILGDTALVDFEGFINGKPFEGGKAEGCDLRLGEGAFIPGFEEGIVGHRATESFDITVTFPEDYDASLAGKKAVFKITLREVRETVTSQADDPDFLAACGVASVDDLKTLVREHLEAQAGEEARKVFAGNLFTLISQGMTADIPDAMVDAQLDSIVSNFESSIKARGLTLNDYLKHSGISLDAFRLEYKELALEQVKADLILDKVAELEGIWVSEDELSDYYNRMAQEHSVTVEQARKYFPPQSLYGEIRLDKAGVFIIENNTPVAED